MAAHESEIMAVNHNVCQHFANYGRVYERLKRQGWCKWTTIKRVNKMMLELLNHKFGDRDENIRAFLKKYHYYGIDVVSELELSEKSNPALVKELHEYCELELKKLHERAKQKRKDIRRLKTINKCRLKRGLLPLKHLPVYNRTRDQRNHARNVRRNLVVIEEREKEILLLTQQQKEEMERMVDEAFDLKHYLLPVQPLHDITKDYEWKNLLEPKVEEPHGLRKEVLEEYRLCNKNIL